MRAHGLLNRVQLQLSCLLLSLLLVSSMAHADLRAAHRAFESGNYKTAFKLLQPLAEAGDVEAQGNLAWLYKNGAGVEQDSASAAEWYRKAAEQGNAYAQYNYGDMCQQGEGVAQSDEEAAKWYLKAAMQGQANAQFSLAEMYLDGAGVEENLVEAYAWIHVVVASGVEAAETLLEEIEFELDEEEISAARDLGQQRWEKYGTDPDAGE